MKGEGSYNDMIIFWNKYNLTGIYNCHKTSISFENKSVNTFLDIGIIIWLEFSQPFEGVLMTWCSYQLHGIKINIFQEVQ